MYILLKVIWTERWSSQATLKEISPEYSLKGLMLKLKLQYSGHLMQRTDSLEKILMPGKSEGRRRRGQQRMRCVGWHHQLDWHEFEQASGVGNGQGSLACCSPWGCKQLDTTEQLNWLTDFIWTSFSLMKSFSPHLRNKKLRFREPKWFIQVLRLTFLILSPLVLTAASLN